MNNPELLELADGRQVEIARIEISRSWEGYEGNPEAVWENIVFRSRRSMNRDRDGRPPAYVVPPVSCVLGQPWRPGWKIAVELRSESLDMGFHAEVALSLGFDDEESFVEQLGFNIWDFMLIPPDFTDRWDNGDYSSVVLVFFSDDLFERPVTNLIGSQVAQMDEEVWVRHACGSAGVKAHRSTRPEQ